MILRATTKVTKNKHSESPLINQSENPANNQVTCRKTGKQRNGKQNEQRNNLRIKWYN